MASPAKCVAANMRQSKALNLKTQQQQMQSSNREQAEPPSPMSHAGILARHAYRNESKDADDESLPALGAEDENENKKKSDSKVRVQPTLPRNTKKGQQQQAPLSRDGSSRKFSFGKFGFFGRRNSSSSSSTNSTSSTTSDEERAAQRVVQQTQTSVGRSHYDVNSPTSSRSARHNYQNTNLQPPSLQNMHVSTPSYTILAPSRPPVGSPLLPPRSPGDERITLVLDLDETLVRSSFDCTFEFDFEAPFALNGCWCTARVRKRPYVDEFLARVAQDFELVLMTAGVEPYASLVLDILDDQRHLEHRFYRDSCTKTDTGLLVKDLSRFNRDLDRTIIVDNSPNAYLWHPQNAVDIDDFVGDSRDRQLVAVADFLHVIKDAKDVRPHLAHWKKGKHYAQHFNNSATGPAQDRRPNGVVGNRGRHSQR